ncbi:MAG: cation:proton antiporter [Burkholderiales bacterium]|nr:cation:proton antiporter [Burkholderiales bacterium]
MGFLAEKLRFPALIGYLLEGILASPKLFGFGMDPNISQQLADVGIMLLMFGVGLNFSLSDLIKVKGLVIPGTIIQMTLSGLAGFSMATFDNAELGSAIIVGMCFSCASTVVVLKALEARGLLEGFDGRIAVGWLIVQDMVTVLLLVLLPPLASILGNVPNTSTLPLWASLLLTFVRVVAFIALMLVIGKRLLPWILWQVAKTGSRELFTLCILFVAIGIAFSASELFNVSFALGAFFAGMVMRESEYAHRAAVESLPLRDAFSVIFFVGVGMMFDYSPVIEDPWYLISFLGIVLVVTPLIAFTLVLLFKYPLHTAMNLACCLGQIGEFSFILASLGLSLGLISSTGMNLVLATAILTIAINPVSFATAPAISKFLVKHFKFARVANARLDPQAVLPDEIEQQRLKRHVVVVGAGPIGRKVTQYLTEVKVPVVVVEKDDELVEELRKEDVAAIQGDCTDPTVLLQAHIQYASQLVLTIKDELVERKTIETAKILNPTVECIIRSMADEETNNMRKDKLGVVIQAPSAAAMLMSGWAYFFFERGKYDYEPKETKLANCLRKIFLRELKDDIPREELEEEMDQGSTGH